MRALLATMATVSLLASDQAVATVVAIDPLLGTAPGETEPIERPSPSPATEYWWLEDTRLNQAHETGHLGDPATLVAVIDTGSDWTHPDLSGAIDANPGEAPPLDQNGVDDDGNGYVDDWRGWNAVARAGSASDDRRHGTHVAGLVHQAAPLAAILPVKFIDASGHGSLEDAVAAIDYAIARGARVLNLSFTFGKRYPELEAAIRRAVDRGAVVVAAAGNSGWDLGVYAVYPAGFDWTDADRRAVLSVAATDRQPHLTDPARTVPVRWEDSNFSPNRVDLAAPGFEIESTLPGGLYGRISGTSMATPLVSGLAALALQAYPRALPREIGALLVDSSRPEPALRRVTRSRGMVDAESAALGQTQITSDPDPNLWTAVPYSLESDHPYPYLSDRTFLIQVAGARFIRPHFTRIDVEVIHDALTIEDPASGAPIQRIDGKLADYAGDYVEGDTLALRLHSDLMANQWGFAIDRVDAIW